jgi:hypothetical protein
MWMVKWAWGTWTLRTADWDCQIQGSNRQYLVIEEGNNFFSRCDIEDRRIFERLCIPSKGAWGNDLCNWDQYSTERDNFKADHSITPTSGEPNIDILRNGINGQLDCNKSIYVGIVPYEVESGKRTIGNKPASTKLLAVCPLISVAPGDFLASSVVKFDM